MFVSICPAPRPSQGCQNLKPLRDVGYWDPLKEAAWNSFLAPFWKVPKNREKTNIMDENPACAWWFLCDLIKCRSWNFHCGGESVDGANATPKRWFSKGQTHGSCAIYFSRRPKTLNAVELGSLWHPQSRTWKIEFDAISFLAKLRCDVISPNAIQGSPSYFWEFEVSQIVKFTQINARLQVIGRMMMEKLLFQERILIHRHCFWWDLVISGTIYSGQMAPGLTGENVEKMIDQWNKGELQKEPSMKRKALRGKWRRHSNHSRHSPA